MKLLHPEVDIVPGRPGQRPQTTPVREEQPLPGSAVLRLTNATTQENAYIVRLRSDRTFWQDSWYTLIGLPPAPGGDNTPPSGKRDERGPQDRWVKLYVPRGGTREVLVRFNVPARPDARAGSYPYHIDVETQVSGQGADPGRRKDRIQSIPAVAIVRPYYKWKLDLLPEEKRIGRRHRSADFELIVTNESNEWLYCDVNLPRPKDLTVECQTLRLSVPPPEPGELLPNADGGEGLPGTQRAIPIKATSKLKIIRGDLTRQAIPITALRVDAPSTPPPPSDGYSGLGAVVAVATTETQQIPQDRALVYCPPIPAKITDFFDKSASVVRTLIFTALGFVVLGIITLVLFQNYYFNGVKVEPMSLEAQPGKTLLVGGVCLQGSKLFMGTKDNWIPVSYIPDITRPNRVTITAVPEELNHKEVKLRVQRFVWFLPFLSALLPSYESKSVVQVGNSIDLAASTPSVDAVAAGPYLPGGSFVITGQNLGSRGVVLVDDLQSKSFWSPSRVTVILRKDVHLGTKLAVKVEPSNGVSLDPGSIEIASPAAPGPEILPIPPPNPSPNNQRPKKIVLLPHPSPGPQPTPNPNPNPKPIPVPIPRPVPTPPIVPGPHPIPRVDQRVQKQQIAQSDNLDAYSAAASQNWQAASDYADRALQANPKDSVALSMKSISISNTQQSSANTAEVLALKAHLNARTPRASALAETAMGDAMAYAASHQDRIDNKVYSIFRKAYGTDSTLGITYIEFANYMHNIKQDNSARAILELGKSNVTEPAYLQQINQMLGNPQ